MNPIERRMRRIDAFQQRHAPLAFLYGVVKKFGDDNAGTLVSNWTYSALMTMFPLLLVLVSILNLVLDGSPSARAAVLHSALSRFPVIGTDLTKNIHSLHRSNIIALIVGLVGLLWGSLGFAQNGIFTMSQLWNLPGPERPNYLKRLGRSACFLGVLAVGVIASTFLAGLGTFGGAGLISTILGIIGSAILNVAGYLLAFRVLTAKSVKPRDLIIGAAVGGIGWTILQALGSFVVGHYLKNDSAVYGTFGIILGLAAWIYLGVELTVYAAEVNVVRHHRLWPRAVVQPPLTDADQRSMAMQATQNQRRPEQHVDVTFDDAAMTQGEFLERGRAAENQPSEK